MNKNCTDEILRIDAIISTRGGVPWWDTRYSLCLVTVASIIQIYPGPF
jgi:hypothetical protein